MDVLIAVGQQDAVLAERVVEACNLGEEFRIGDGDIVLDIAVEVVGADLLLEHLPAQIAEHGGMDVAPAALHEVKGRKLLEQVIVAGHAQQDLAGHRRQRLGQIMQQVGRARRADHNLRRQQRDDAAQRLADRAGAFARG